MTNSVIISIHLILAASWRKRYLIIIPTLVLPIFAVIAFLIAPRTWETHSTILVQESAKMNPFLEDLSISTDLANRMATLDTLLHSRHMLINVANDLGLINDDSTNQQKEYIVKKLSNSLTVMLIGKDLVKIIYKADTVENITKVLISVRNRFLDDMLAPELSSIVASEDFLTRQLKLKTNDLHKAEYKLASFKKDNSEHLPRLYGVNNKRFSELTILSEKKKIELSGAIAAKKTIRNRLAQVDPIMSVIEKNIVSTKSDLGILLSRYTDKHSKVEIAYRKLSQLESERKIQSKKSYEISEEDLIRLWESANSTQDLDSKDNNMNNTLLVSQLQELQIADSQVEKIKEEIRSIDKQTESLKVTLSLSSEMERQLLSLERDLKVQRGLYSDLLLRYEKAKITGALGKFEQPQRVKIIDEPYQPSGPNNFPLYIYIFAGLFGGISLGCGIALISELSNTTIRARYQLEILTKKPVITRIPRISGTQGIGENI
jgi:uncharacterized protein involved in exopolysaccharide biosynthesis